MYTLYILRCNNNALYTGITTDLDSRLEKHRQGLGSKYVKANLPFKLLYTEELADRSIATKREIEVKKLSKDEKEKLALK